VTQGCDGGIATPRSRDATEQAQGAIKKAVRVGVYISGGRFGNRRRRLRLGFMGLRSFSFSHTSETAEDLAEESDGPLARRVATPERAGGAATRLDCVRHLHQLPIYSPRVLAQQ
jgi:hypothetical protein